MVVVEFEEEKIEPDATSEDAFVDKKTVASKAACGSIGSGSKEVKESAEVVFKVAKEVAVKDDVEVVKKESEEVGVKAIAKQDPWYQCLSTLKKFSLQIQERGPPHDSEESLISASQLPPVQGDKYTMEAAELPEPTTVIAGRLTYGAQLLNAPCERRSSSVLLSRLSSVGIGCRRQS